MQGSLGSVNSLAAVICLLIVQHWILLVLMFSISNVDYFC